MEINQKDYQQDMQDAATAVGQESLPDIARSLARNQTDSTNQPSTTSFHFFPHLPAELRIKIWELALKRPQNVMIRAQGLELPDFLGSLTQYQEISHVNIESRLVSERLEKVDWLTYRKSSAGGLKKFFYRPNLDILWIYTADNRCRRNIWERIPGVWGDVPEAIRLHSRTLAMSWDIGENIFMWSSRSIDVLSRFHAMGVKKLLFVINGPRRASFADVGFVAPPRSSLFPRALIEQWAARGLFVRIGLYNWLSDICASSEFSFISWWQVLGRTVEALFQSRLTKHINDVDQNLDQQPDYTGVYRFADTCREFVVPRIEFVEESR